MTVEATSAAGRTVTFTATATDLVDGARPVSCTPASGSTFALGTTTVNCSASDTRGNSASGSFTVTVRDTIAPTASITSPGNGAAVAGTISVSAAASDAVGISSVKLYVDGVLKATDITSPYSFSLDTAAYSDGSHTLRVTATDTSSNQGSSALVNISIDNIIANDGIAPVVSIISPADGSTIPAGTSSVLISISASDPAGISKVEIYVDGRLKAILNGNGDTTGTYDYSWAMKKVRNGSHTIKAIAYDMFGNSASDSISLTKLRK
jgi:Big-like domain-containing protein/HYR domain-containing protein